MKWSILASSLFLFLGFTRPHFQTHQVSAFTLVDEEDGIKLYERWHSPESGEPYRELKAVVMVQAEPSEMVKALQTERIAPRWMQHVEAFNYLNSGQKNQWHTYVKYGMPWPMRDYDCVLLFQQTTLSTGAIRVVFESDQLQQYPPNNGVERLGQLAGSWHFKPQVNGRSEVTHHVMTKKPSNLPRMVIDPIVRSNLITTMGAFRDVVQAL